MAQQVDGAAMPLDTEKVGIKGYLAFFLTIIFFSGVFSGSEGWWRVFDFTVLNGSFGHVTGTQTFRGCIDSLEVRKKPGGHWIIRDLMGLDLVGLASL